MTKDNDRRKSCCDAIITVTNEQKNINERIEKTIEKRIENLETLYKPVNRLTFLFYFCTFILSSLLLAASYLFLQVVDTNINVTRILESNKAIKEDIGELKASSCIAREAYKADK